MSKNNLGSLRLSLSRYLFCAAEDSRVAGYDKVSPIWFIAHLFSSPGLLAVFLYRTAYLLNNEFGFLGRVFAKLFTRLNQFINCCDLNVNAVIGPGFYLPHPYGVVVGKNSVIGERCTMYQNSTLGMRHTANGSFTDGYPVLGSGVRIFAGAVVCGPIHISDGAVIGANSVVSFDVPPYGLAVGVPGRIVLVDSNMNCNKNDS